MESFQLFPKASTAAVPGRVTQIVPQFLPTEVPVETAHPSTPIPAAPKGTGPAIILLFNWITDHPELRSFSLVSQELDF